MTRTHRARVMNAALAMTRAQEGLVKALFRRQGDTDVIVLDPSSVDALRELRSQLDELVPRAVEAA